MLHNIELIKKNKILIENVKLFTKENKLVFDEIVNCVGELVYFKKNVGSHGARNPFRKVGTYDGYIYEFKNDLLPDCIE